MTFLFQGREKADFVGHHPFPDDPVGSFDKAVLIDPCIRGKRRYQADIRALRRFDRAYAPVVGRVYVADLESGPFAGQAARSESRETALVGHLGQGVGLVHELGKLR